jgi:hypothetical protein
VRAQFFDEGFFFTGDFVLPEDVPDFFFGSGFFGSDFFSGSEVIFLNVR